MTKLKTLKDLEITHGCYAGHSTIIITKELKAEAAKWVKKVPELWEEWWEEHYEKNNTDELFGQWLLNKIFNLTEDDISENEGRK